MILTLLKSQIQNARITALARTPDLHLAIDSELMAEAGILPFERLLVSNSYSGANFETYAIPDQPGARRILLAGAPEAFGQVGDALALMAFVAIPEGEAALHRPRSITLDSGNRVVRNGC